MSPRSAWIIVRRRVSPHLARRARGGLRRPRPEGSPLEARAARTFTKTAARYQMYHALALVLVGLLALHVSLAVVERRRGVLRRPASLIFSGLLYAWPSAVQRSLGAIVPAGGHLPSLSAGSLWHRWRRSSQKNSPDRHGQCAVTIRACVNRTRFLHSRYQPASVTVKPVPAPPARGQAACARRAAGA